MKHALITGIGGQDGTLLSWYLHQDGWRVSGVVGCHTQEIPERPETEKIFRLDLTDAQAVEQLIAEIKPDVVFHLAARHFSSEHEKMQEAEYWTAMDGVNVMATKLLTEAMIRHVPHATLIYAGSSQMYTPTKPVVMVDEQTPFNPINYYAKTKIEATQYLHEIYMAGQLKTVTAILFNHESPLRSVDFLSRKISLAVAKISLGHEENLHLRNIGSMVDWSAAEDIAQALKLIAITPCAPRFILGSGRLRGVRTMLNTAFTIIGKNWQDHVSFDKDETGMALCAKPDFARSVLYWRSAISFEEMISRMIEIDRERIKSGAS
ncbi:MAG: GDP-mannose 4,6-dehydratase [Alphaproteobacteria bacterium]